MDNDALIASLERKKKKTIIILTVATALLFALAILFSVLTKLTMTVETPEASDGIFAYLHYLQYPTVHYNPVYRVGSAVFLCLALFSLSYLLCAMFFIRVKTLTVDGNDFIHYVGFFTSRFYINGKEAERQGHYLEARLRDGSKVTVSFSRRLLHAHLSFDGNRPSADL